MKIRVEWTVIVSFKQNNRVIVLTIATDVRHGENAVPQARMRNQGGGYHWENAELRKVRRLSITCWR
jgi:hypothetical protein